MRRRTFGATALLTVAAGVAFGVGGGLRTEDAKLTASDVVRDDVFGYSVAVAGDTAVVGAFQKNSSSGAAYVFTRTGTTWTEEATLSAADGGFLGNSVAISGDTVVAGAPSTNFNEGAAYVFTRTGTTWTPQAKLTTTDCTSNDFLGVSVAIEGDTAVVGAPDKDSARGAVYVFKRVGTAWTQDEKLTASDGEDGAYFGNAVAIENDTVVVGDQQKDGYLGAAYVFTRTGSTWQQQAMLTPADPADPGQQDVFGSSVAISGGTVLVGALGKDTSAGAVYAFTRTGTAWTQRAKLTAGDRQSNDRFGASVALAGDVAAIGAYGDGFNAPGSAYVFTRTGTNWTQREKLRSAAATNGDNFGERLALSGGTLVVGDQPRAPNLGAAYVFALPQGGRPPGYCLPAKIRAKPNAAHPEKSTLTASGMLEPGTPAADFDRAATFDVGGFHLDVPAFVRKGGSLVYDANGISLKLTPQKDGLSHAAFSVKVVGDLAGKVDLAAPLRFRFTSQVYDIEGSAYPTTGALGLVTPGLAVIGAKATIKGGGGDSLRMTLRFVTDGVAPPVAEDLTICFGENYTSPLLASASFVRKGEAYVRTAKSPGITKATVDYAKGTITIAGKGLDLGAFQPSGNTVVVTLVLGSDARFAQILMGHFGTKLTY